MNPSSLGSQGLFMLAPLLFSSNMVAARWIGDAVPPATLAFGRWCIVALALLPFIWQALQHHIPLVRQHLKHIILLAILGGALSVAPQYAAAQHTSAGHIALIFALSPVLISLIDRLVWKGSLTPAVILGALLAFTGIGMAVFEGSLSHALHLQLNIGDALALLAATAWAGYTALLRRHPVNLPPLLMLWLVATGAALSLLPVVPAEWLNKGVPMLSWRAAMGMLFVAMVAGIAAYACYARIVQLFGAARASMAMYLIPVYTFMLGDLLLGEALHMYHLFATVLVFAGIGLATIKWQHVRRSRIFA